MAKRTLFEDALMQHPNLVAEIRKSGDTMDGPAMSIEDYIAQLEAQFPAVFSAKDAEKNKRGKQ